MRMKNGRRSNLPKRYVIKHLEELVERNPTIKPAEALRNLKAALRLPHPLEHDKAIKSNVSSIKIKSQRESKHFVTFIIVINGVHAYTCVSICYFTEIEIVCLATLCTASLAPVTIGKERIRSQDWYSD